VNGNVGVNVSVRVCVCIILEQIENKR